MECTEGQTQRMTEEMLRGLPIWACVTSKKRKMFALSLALIESVMPGGVHDSRGKIEGNY